MTLALLGLAMLCLLISLVFQIGVIRQCRREKKQTNREPYERPGKLFKLACSFQQGFLKEEIGLAGFSGFLGLFGRLFGKHGEQRSVPIQRHSVRRSFWWTKIGSRQSNVSQQGRNGFVQVLIRKSKMAVIFPLFALFKVALRFFVAGGSDHRNGETTKGAAELPCSIGDNTSIKRRQHRRTGVGAGWRSNFYKPAAIAFSNIASSSIRRRHALAAFAFSIFGSQYASVISTTRSKLQHFSSKPAAAAGVVPSVL